MTEAQFGDYIISTDKSRLELDVIQDFLNNSSYWAQDRPLATIRTTIENSLCFGVYVGDRQVGFARVVTDYATFAWLADVFVLEAHRGRYDCFAWPPAMPMGCISNMAASSSWMALIAGWCVGRKQKSIERIRSERQERLDSTLWVGLLQL